MPSKMKTAYQFNILYPGNNDVMTGRIAGFAEDGQEENPTFAGLNDSLTLHLIQDAIHRLINTLALETDFHKEVSKMGKGENGEFNIHSSLNNNSMHGLEFIIRLIAVHEFSSNKPFIRLDLIYKPDEVL